MRTIRHDGATWLHLDDLTARLGESVTRLQCTEILAGQECLGDVPPTAAPESNAAPDPLVAEVQAWFATLTPEAQALVLSGEATIHPAKPAPKPTPKPPKRSET